MSDADYQKIVMARYDLGEAVVRLREVCEAAGFNYKKEAANVIYDATNADFEIDE